MHILLTDVVVCPRCGPEFGLILLADRIAERRVLEGRLGCPNCREQYEVRGGRLDLTTPGAARPESTQQAALSDLERVPDAGIRIAALLGVTQGPAYVLLAGAAAQHAAEVRDALVDVEVIAVVPEAVGTPVDEPGLSEVVATGLPVSTGRMSGVALTGTRTSELLEAAARAVRPTGRLLVDPAPTDAVARLARAGLRQVALEGNVLLAVRG